MITMRPAEASDADTLFAWRNDPITQACSRSTAPVMREDHAKWMKFNVEQGYPTHMVMMAETNIGTVGVVRFDNRREDVMTYDVSITMAPQHRGKGLSVSVLSEAMSWMADYTVHAEVRQDNTASRRLFEHCGFEEISRSNGFLNYLREPVR